MADKLQLSADANYEHDHNLYYGFTDSTLQAVLGKTRDDISVSDYRAKYNVASLNLGVRSMNLDAYALGYAANLRLSDLWASWGQNEFNLNLSGDVHYGFTPLRGLMGVAYLHAEWDGYTHSQPNRRRDALGYNGHAYPHRHRSRQPQHRQTQPLRRLHV